MVPKFKPNQKVLMLKHGNWPADATAVIMSFTTVGDDFKNAYWIAFDKPQVLDCGNGKIAYNTICIGEEYLTIDLSGTAIVIDYAMAWRMRNERGWYLPIDKEYVDVRLKNIAKRQHVLMKEFNLLDEELRQKAAEQTAGQTDKQDETA